MSSSFCLQTHSLLISTVSSYCRGDIYLKKCVQLIEKWQFSPTAWSQQRGVGMVTHGRGYTESIGGRGNSTMCCHMGRQPVIAISSISQERPRFRLPCDLSHFLKSSSVVLFAAYRRQIANRKTQIDWQ